MCGGTIAGLPSVKGGIGLSPRVRGNPLPRWRREAGAGSIPACAGEPAAARRDFRNKRVYPRVCGGTTPVAAVAAANEGLSPRVRGNLRTEQPVHLT